MITLRPWAAVWRVMTPVGVFYAKQNCSPLAHEAALVRTLNELAAPHVVPVAATDLTRGLLLTPDQGQPIGDVTVDDWCRVLAASAQLQLDVSRHVDTLVGLGLPVLGAADASTYVALRLEDLELTDQQQENVLRVLPDLDRWADQVGSLGLPLTLCHTDLHGWNVFDHVEEIRFADFADAMVTEPLFALLHPLQNLRHQLDCAPHDPRLLKVADAALEVWTQHAPIGDLRAALPAVTGLARLTRLESWLQCLPSMSDPERAVWGPLPARWLASLGDPVLIRWPARGGRPTHAGRRRPVRGPGSPARSEVAAAPHGRATQVGSVGRA